MLSTTIYLISWVLDISTIGGNLGIIALFLCYPDIRKARNYIIFSLACADLLIGTIAIPFAAKQNHDGAWLLSEHLCYTHVLLDMTGTLVSIFTVTLTSLMDIWLVYGGASKQINTVYTGRNVAILIALTWTLPLSTVFIPVVVTPDSLKLFTESIDARHYDLSSLVFQQSVNDEPGTTNGIVRCLPNFKQSLFLGIVIFYYVIGMTITLSSYIAIFVYIKRQKAMMLCTNAVNNSRNKNPKGLIFALTHFNNQIDNAQACISSKKMSHNSSKINVDRVVDQTTLSIPKTTHINNDLSPIQNYSSPHFNFPVNKVQHTNVDMQSGASKPIRRMSTVRSSLKRYKKQPTVFVRAARSAPAEIYNQRFEINDTGATTSTFSQAYTANVSRWYRNSRVLRMTFAVGVLTCVCYLPGCIIFLLQAYQAKATAVLTPSPIFSESTSNLTDLSQYGITPDYYYDRKPQVVIQVWVYTFGIWFSYLKSGINPVIYGFLNVKFNTHIRAICFPATITRQHAITAITSHFRAGIISRS